MDSRLYESSPAASALADSRLHVTSRNWLICRSLISHQTTWSDVATARKWPRCSLCHCGVASPPWPACMEVPLPPRLSWIPAFAGMTTQNVIPAAFSPREGGGDPCGGDQRRTRSRRHGVEIPCSTAGAGPLTLDGCRGNDGIDAEVVIPAQAGIHVDRGGRGTSIQAGIHRLRDEVCPACPAIALSEHGCAGARAACDPVNQAAVTVAHRASPPRCAMCRPSSIAHTVSGSNSSRHAHIRRVRC